MDSSELSSSGGEQLVTSNGTSIASKSSSKESRTVAWMPHLAFQTLMPLSTTVLLIALEEWLKSLRQVSHASHSASQDNSFQQATHETNGLQPRMSFAWFDQSSRSLKMSQGFLALDTVQPSSVTWPRSGTLRNGMCFQLPTRGGPHLRERLFILAADPAQQQCYGSADNGQSSVGCAIPELGNSPWAIDDSDRRSKRRQRFFRETVSRKRALPWGESLRSFEDLRNRPDIPEPLVRRMDDGVASGVDRLRAIGNGQVPRVVVRAWTELSRRIGK